MWHWRAPRTPQLAHTVTPKTSSERTSHALAPTDPSERTTSPVFDSLDLMKVILDFADAPTVFGARPTSSTFRDAGSAVPGRISMSQFDSISASLVYHGRWELEDPDGYDTDASYGSSGPPRYWVTERCHMNPGYYYGGLDDATLEPVGPREDDLKHLIALVEPQIMFDIGPPYPAPNGKWFTVGDIFEAIGKFELEFRRGESDHIFFDGICVRRSQRAAPVWCGPSRDAGIVELSVLWGS